MVDNFTTTRSWSYKLLEDAGQHSHREDKLRRHQGRQDTQDNMETLPKLLRPKETGKSSNHGDTTWKTAPKFDTDSRPRCFYCNFFSNFAKECHNSKKGNDKEKLSAANMAVEICENSDSEDNKPLTIEAVNLLPILTHRQEVALVKERLNWPITAIMNGKQCQNILLEPSESKLCFTSH